MEPEIEADFLRRKARDLPADYVRDWYFAAFSERIGHEHVAWILPRVMEMLANGECVALVGNEVAFSRLPLTGFPDRWPKREVEAVKRFSLALLEAWLADLPVNVQPDSDTLDLDALLCMFGEGGIDINPLLRRLDQLSDDELADLLHRNWFYGERGAIGFNAFWSREAARSLAWKWYTSLLLLQRMERAATAGNEMALKVHALIADVRARDGL